MWLKAGEFRHLIVKIPLSCPFLLSAAVFFSFFTSVAIAQENYGTWSESIKIFINTTSSGANVSQNVYNFPVLQLSSGCIPVSGIFRFQPANPLGASLRFGLRCDTIPCGYRLSDSRVYHHDTADYYMSKGGTA